MSHADIAEREWLRQQELFDAIFVQGFREYAAAIPGIQRAFVLDDRHLRCIDEGTPGGIHLAGSGILLRDRAKEVCQHAVVNGIFSHAGCGAAALYVKKAGLDISDPDEAGKEWAKELAEALDVPYLGHIGTSELTRPPHLHTARVAYYDGTGEFDPSHVHGLPKGFVISRAYLDAVYALQEAKVSADIALGDHGFGSLFTEQNPFLLVAVGTEKAQRQSLELELEEVAKTYGGRVKVEGMSRMV